MFMNRNMEREHNIYSKQIEEIETPQSIVFFVCENREQLQIRIRQETMRENSVQFFMVKDLYFDGPNFEYITLISQEGEHQLFPCNNLQRIKFK